MKKNCNPGHPRTRLSAGSCEDEPQKSKSRRGGAVQRDPQTHQPNHRSSGKHSLGVGVGLQKPEKLSLPFFDSGVEIYFSEN